MRVLFLGDIVGSPGRELVRDTVAFLKQQYNPDFIIANAENAAAGSGLTAPLAKELLAYGLDGLTLGNHVWAQKGFAETIDSLEQVCRPANLPTSCPGRRFLILKKGALRLGVATLMGQNGIAPQGDCPFRAADSLIAELTPQVDALILEIHAEYTSEKVALSWYVDGRVGALLGTHTHIPTADTRILPKGTAYQTDLGMTGPYDSVLGREIQPIVDRFLDRMPRRIPVATRNLQLWGCFLQLGPSGLAEHIERVQVGASGVKGPAP